jgi:DNA helicase II / ATP-dependent DNA helicase PcrA
MPRKPTEQQRPVVETLSGRFAVRACPGSGKTFSVAARFDRLLSGWQSEHCGIAVASFTNVAWREVELYLKNEFGRKLPAYPHFLGTLDSFINKYVFLPFGHLVMKSTGRPILVGPPHDDTEPIGDWLFWGKANQACNKYGCKLNQFTYDLDGNVIRLQHATMGHNCSEPNRPCVSFKRSFNAKGSATQSDANYFALRVLQQYPTIAAALVARFPMMMVDEAQDTSAIQMALLDCFVAAGLEELMLVGDPDQAVYEWRDAEPSVFLAKCTTNGAKITENWRSSQLICDCASRFSSSERPMKAANPEVANYAVQPRVVGYADEGELPVLVTEFVEQCQSQGVQKTNISVQVRSTKLLNVIMPGSVGSNIYPWADDAPLSRPFANAKYLRERGLHADALHIMERALYRQQHPTRRGSPTFRELYSAAEDLKQRGEILALLDELPSTSDVSLGAWIAAATHTFEKLQLPYRLRIKEKSPVCNYPALSFRETFGTVDVGLDDANVKLQTVHAAKGQSLDAVLLILKRRAGISKYYINLLGQSITESEELRIVYVGITRAKRMLTIAVPAQDVTRWQNYLGLVASNADEPQTLTTL